MKILKEQQYSPAIAVKEPRLSTAMLNNCFTEKWNKSTVQFNGKEALWYNTPSGNYTYYLTVGDEQPNNEAKGVYFTINVVDKTGKIVQTSDRNTCPNLVTDIGLDLNTAGPAGLAIEVLLSNSKNYISNKDLVDQKLDKKNYQEVDIRSDPESKAILDKNLDSVTIDKLLKMAPIKMWKSLGARQTKENIQQVGQKILDALEASKWITNPEKVDKSKLGYYFYFDLGKPDTYPQEYSSSDYKNAWPTYFPYGYLVYKLKSDFGTLDSTPQNLKIQAFRNDPKNSIEACKNTIVAYGENFDIVYTEAINNNPLTAYSNILTQLDNTKNQVQDCFNNWGIPNFKRALGNKGFEEFKKNIKNMTSVYPQSLKGYQIVVDLEKDVRLGSEKPKGKINQYLSGVRQVKEEVILKKVISESLMKFKKTKEDSLNEEKVIRKHLAILSEGRNFKKKGELNVYYGDLLNEIIYLNSKGYNEKIISEQTINSLWNLFGGPIMGGAYDYFKEYIGKWVVETLGIDSKGWLGNIIIVGLGNLKLSDLLTIWKCDKFVAFMSSTISEAIIRKYTSSKGMEGALEGVLRNSITKMLSSSHFIKAIEDGLENAICPMLSDLGSKIDKVSTSLATKESGEAPSQTNS